MTEEEGTDDNPLQDAAMMRVTVVGGGLAGLIAATECAEAGVPVTLLEARSGLGGRADLPGSTWRDRPAIQQDEHLWLAGDWVAAPGHLSQVSCNSAVQAARAARHAAEHARS